MTCEQCLDKLTDLLEGELGPEIEREVRQHLAACPECARKLSQIRGLVGVLHGLPEIEPPEELRARLRSIPRNAEQPDHAWWRRWRPIATGFAAAAAIVLMLSVGLTFYQREAGQVPGELVAERTAAPEASSPSDVEVEPAREPETAEALAESSDGIEPATTPSEEATAAPDTASELPPPPADRGTGARVEPPPRTTSVRDLAAAAPAETVDAESPPAPYPRPRPTVAARPTADDGSAEKFAPVPATTVPGTDVAHERYEEDERPTRAAGPPAPVAPAGSAGPAAGGGGRAMVAAMEAPPEPDVMAMPAPAYLDAGEGVGSARVGEGTPFTVGVTPPHEKVVGTIVPATIRLETEADVARARVTVAGSGDLQLIGVDDNGIVFEGPLTAGQETVVSVRMLAQTPGEQAITLRIRSTDPIVDTQLDVGMGEFTAPVPPAERPVTFKFVGAPIREAVAEITRRSGLSVIVDPGVGAATVTARADDPIPAAAALRVVAEAAGLQVSERRGAWVVEGAPEQP